MAMAMAAVIWAKVVKTLEQPVEMKPLVARVPKKNSTRATHRGNGPQSWMRFPDTCSPPLTDPSRAGWFSFCISSEGYATQGGAAESGRRRQQLSLCLRTRAGELPHLQCPLERDFTIHYIPLQSMQCSALCCNGCIRLSSSVPERQFWRTGCAWDEWPCIGCD